MKIFASSKIGERMEEKKKKKNTFLASSSCYTINPQPNSLKIQNKCVK